MKIFNDIMLCLLFFFSLPEVGQLCEEEMTTTPQGKVQYIWPAMVNDTEQRINNEKAN